MFALARNCQIRQFQRLSIDVSIHHEFEKLAELIGIDVLGRQGLFIERSASPGVVIL